MCEFECIVCLNKMKYHYRPAGRITAACTHEPNICTACLAEQLASESGTHKCAECTAVMTISDVARLGFKALADEYNHQALLAYVRDVPEFRWCLRSGCGSGQIHECGALQPIVTCVKCKHKTCYTHQVKWHEGWTCAQYEANRPIKKRDEEKKSLKWIQDNTKKCPNCVKSIEKSGGCSHMIW